jgi:hypothetical protein
LRSKEYGTFRKASMSANGEAVLCEWPAFMLASLLDLEKH